VNRTRPALVVFWTSIGVIVATLIVLGTFKWRAQEEAVVESVGSRPAATASPSPTPTPAETTASASPAPVETPGPQMVAAPVRVSIPALDVNTKVFPVGLDKNNAIEIPEDIRYVGWYDLGVPPGVDRGSAVLVAHRDGRVQGRGVFYFLGTLDVGDKVIVKTSAGDDLPYEVVARESIRKKRLPYEELFAVDGPPRLTLISCGGYYDPNNGGYQDNVVVTAVPMFDPIPTDPIPTDPSASPSPSGSASSSSEASPAATSAEGPVSVAAPQAATIMETSKPVLLGGSASR
jgi:sortase (surface protein transpeptidase)